MTTDSSRALALVLVVALMACRRREEAAIPTGDAAVDVAVDSMADEVPPSDTHPQYCTQPIASPRCDNGWCRIEAGCFVMGSPRDEFGSAAYADVQVEVTLTRPFLMQQMELTQREWLNAGFANPSSSTEFARDCLDPECPVGEITFSEAIVYANYLSRSAASPLPECYAVDGCTGSPGLGLNCDSIKVAAASIYACAGYRLPTEAEWEYAARAGTVSAFFSGAITSYPSRTECNADPNLDGIAWYCNNSGKSTHPVGKKTANGWGLHDVSGNAAEWVNDYFDGLGYGTGPAVDPQGPSLSASLRVFRGGSATSPAIVCKSSYREEVPSKASGVAHGVRLAITATAQ